MNLQKLYIKNYANHPAFQINRKPLTMDSILLNDFNSTYGFSRKPISNLAILKSKNLLLKIFEQFRSQQVDLYERTFIDELHKEILKFLEDEFNFRAKIKHIKNLDRNAKSLNHMGYFYSELSESTLSEILRIAEPQINVFREKARSGLLKRSDLSINDGEIVKKISRLLDKEFKSKKIFDSVSDYVGIKYSYTGLALELSVEGSTWWRNAIQGVLPPKTMYAHLDESVYAPKAIIYLSNVNHKNGPTSSYPEVYDSLKNNNLQDIIGRVIGRVGSDSNSILFDYYSRSYHQSMGSENFRRHFMLLPEVLRFNSHFGWDILADTELEDFVADQEEVMLGGPGKFVVFDGSRLLHRGGLIEHGERLVLQVVFCPKSSLTKQFLLFSKSILQKINFEK